jgi:hypothetical protein
MITPNQVPLTQPKNHEAEIEEYFDQKLMAGERTIGLPRSGWSVFVLQRVLDKYRENGWKVTDTGLGFRFEPRP